MQQNSANLVVGFASRLAEVIGEAPKSAFARKAGLTESSVRQYLSGKTLPNSEALVAISVAAGVSVDWLLFGGQRRQAEGVAMAQSHNFAMVPRHEIRASAGSGLVPVEDAETAELVAFRRDWLSRIGVNPDRAALIAAIGDSMEPTIPDGAIMLIDMAIDGVRNGRIYAIVRNGELLVKRIQKKVDGKILLLSDNERYEREEVDEATLEQLHIVGRVRWIGRTF